MSLTGADMQAHRAAILAATGGPRDLPATGALLEDWLSQRSGNTTSVGALRTPDGAGVSNETVLFDATWVEEGAGPVRRPLALRVAPTAVRLFPDPLFEQQYQLLDQLHRRNLVRVAAMLWFEPDPSLLGAPFFVMGGLEGRVPISSPVYNAAGWLFDATPEQRRTAWTAAVTELTRIHRVPVDVYRFLDRPELGATGNQQQLGYWERYCDWCSDGRPDESQLATGQWLRDHAPVGPGGLAWDDARIGNMMFDEQFALVGVMDWEQVSSGGARHALGWWLYFDHFHSTAQGVARLPGLGDRDETVSLWETLTGESAGDLSWYEAFAGHKLALISIRTLLAMGHPMQRALALTAGIRARVREVGGIDS